MCTVTRFLTPLLLTFLLFGCDDGDGMMDVDSGPGMDAGPPEPMVDAGPDPSAICDELGLPTTAFDASGTGDAFEEVAGDFTVETLSGSWTLSENWSGCESYVFVNWLPNAYGDTLWASSVDEIFTLGPRNVHYFFAAHATEPSTAMARATEMQAKFEEGFVFQALTPEERAFWEEHIHFVSQPLREVQGSIGAFVNASPVLDGAFAITRQQRFDPVGSLSTIGAGGFAPLLSMARFVAPYYDFIQELDDQIAADTDATVVSLLTDEDTTLRTLDRTVTLPDAATMDGFDTLELDVELTCLLTPDACSEWDRIAHVFLCDDLVMEMDGSTSCTNPQEVTRWITPYSRPGRRRWLMNATPMLGLLQDGGEHHFRMVFGPNWEEATPRTVSIDLRFSNRGEADRPIGAELAFRGGAFDADYNMRAPFSFTPPAGTTRVEIVSTISGHGQTDGDNCAEWCNHVHTFAVNAATDHVIDYPGEAGQRNGCADLARQGVPPGQWGNWSPLRAGWCPGYPVPQNRIDVTSDVDLTSTNELTYRGTFMGGEPRGGNISLSVYVVYFQ